MLLLLLATQGNVFSQQLCVGEDSLVCINQPVRIDVCDALTNVTGGTIVLNNPSYVTLTDDRWSAAVSIGFTFNFYGQNYTQAVIGSNGLISFETSRAGGSCEWSTGSVTTFPSTSFTTAKNTAMLCYQDINPSNGGRIYYQTLGVAPNRVFYVVYENIQMFSAPDCNYMAASFHESTNEIEFHISQKSINTGWNGGRATQGLQNAAGNQAIIITGRNNSQWTATNDARLFAPSSPSNTNTYTSSQIPMKTIRRNDPTSLIWRSTNGQTFPYNNGVLNLSNNTIGRFGYYISYSSTACNSSTAYTGDTSWITVGNLSLQTTTTTDICNSSSGSVTVSAAGGQGNYTYNWPSLGATTATVNNVLAGSHQVQVRDLNGCTGVATAIVPNQTAAFTATSTLVSCSNGADGTATAVMTPALGTISYLWDDGQTTQTATGLTAGSHSCTITSTVGCSGVATVTVSEITPMTVTIDSFTDATCNRAADGTIYLSTTNGTAPYTYTWSNSPSGTASNSASALDLIADTHVILVTDANGCTQTISQVISEPQPLSISQITPDTQICPEDQLQLNATGAGGSSPYIFNWYSNNQLIGSTSSITVDPTTTNTQYCLELTEECGSSAMTSSCMVITFPTPIPPQLSATAYEDCLPAMLMFNNDSPNQSELVSTYIDFGDTKNENFLNGAGGSHEYLFQGNYTLTVSNTSIYGCVYTQVFDEFFRAITPPTARFNFNNNPTSVFETTVPTYDKSTEDVINWQWSAPGATPSTSSAQNPIFTYPEGEEGVFPVTLIVTSQLGCTDTLTLDLRIEDDILFFAPNAFTPNGDEINNSWKFSLKGADIYNFNLVVYNRWGEAIFETNDPAIGWDGNYNGKPVQTGQYSWKAQVKNKNNEGRSTYSGYVNVLR